MRRAPTEPTALSTSIPTTARRGLARNSSGRRVCLNDRGHSIVETIAAHAAARTNQVGYFSFSKTSLRIGRELASTSRRLRIEGEEIKGAVIGLPG